MILEKRSPLTKEYNRMELPITVEEYEIGISSGEHIQNAFPQLSPDQREFILTGYTSEDWDNLFGDDE